MQLIIDTPNKELNKAIEDKVRGDKESTSQSNPRKPETTIMKDMESILLLVEKHKRLKAGKYE
jgi:hypothetical protein